MMEPYVFTLIPALVVRRLVAPFFDEAPRRPVYLAECCGRIYVGRAPAETCRTCKKPPENKVLNSREELDRDYPAAP